MIDIAFVAHGQCPLVLLAWRVWTVATILVAAFFVSPAIADSRLVVVGLRPVAADGTGDLGRLAEAQALRAVFHGVMNDVVGQRVAGHDELVKALGPNYLVTWFKCADDLACISRLLQPTLKAGTETAITGNYSVTETGFRIRIIVFRIADSKVTKELAFDALTDAAKEAASWRDAAVRILANARLRIRSNVAGATCTLDGQPCVFESDQQTIAVMPGDHTIELTKANYERWTSVVTVTADTEQEIAIALRPVAAARPPGDPNPTAASRGPSLPAIRTDQQITLDGKLDDSAWTKAWLETKFTQKFPDEGKPPTQRTEVRVLYDDNAIYVGVRCFDKTPEAIVARLTRRDRDIPGDRVSVDISSKNDRATAFHFQVNAAGVQLDGLWFNDTEYNNDWDGRWYSSTTIDEQGWTAELEIPLATLRYAGDVSSFGFQVRRYLGRRGEIEEWAYIPSTAQGEVSYYGTLADVNGLRAKRLFEVLLYDTRGVIRRANQGAFDGLELTDRFGADVRLGVTPALTLDASFNPDFGTVEVDQVILNLTTVEQYFPEKRRFFIEGAELFATPFQMFYSRRLGAVPPAPSIGSLAEPLPNGKIWGAGKLTGVLTGRLSIAVLETFTARRDAVVERSTGETDKVLADPATNFAVVRLKQEFGTNSSVGLIATAVNRIEPRGAAAPLPDDVCPVPYTTAFTSFAPPTPRDGRCTNDGYALGLDTVLRTSDGEWGAKAQVVGTRVQNGPSQLIPDGTALGTGDFGLGAMTALGRYGGKHWLFNVTTQHLSPRFQINDAGYLTRANLHEVVPSLTWRTTKPLGPLQSIELVAQVGHRRNYSGQHLGTDPQLLVTSQFKNLWSLQLILEPYYPRWYEDRETQDGAITERNRGFYYFLNFSTDPNKAVVFGTSFSVLKNLGGLLSTGGTATLSANPTPALELALLATVNGDFAGPRWFDTTFNPDGTRTYLFAELDVRVADVTLRGTYTLSRKLSLQTYLQAFLASGRWSNPTETTVAGSRPTLYLDKFVAAPGAASVVSDFDFRAGAVNVNMFLRYEYLPLSALWLVYTREQQQSPYDPMEGRGRLRFDRFANGPSTDVVLVKATYLWH